MTRICDICGHELDMTRWQRFIEWFRFRLVVCREERECRKQLMEMVGDD